MKTLNIEPRFQEALRPLSDDELTLLRESLRENGCLDPIITWANSEDIIIDGHNRYRLCQELGITFKTKAIALDGQDAAIEWIRKNQEGRRNVTENEKRYRLGKLYNERKQSKGGDRNPTGRAGKESKAVRRPLITTAEQIAKEQGVGKTAVKKAGNFAKEIDKLPDEKRKAILESARKYTITKMEPNQKQKILERLKLGWADASELATIAANYHGRIYELREAGHNIKAVNDGYELDTTKPSGKPKPKPKLIKFKGTEFTPPADAAEAMIRIREIVLKMETCIKQASSYRVNWGTFQKLVIELDNLTLCFEAPNKRTRHGVGTQNGAVL